MIAWLVCVFVVFWSPWVSALQVQSISLESEGGASVMSAWAWGLVPFILITLVCMFIYGRRAYLRLSKDQAKMQAIWSNIPDVLTEVDKDGVILALNQTLIPDTPVESIVGTSSFAYLNEEGKALFRQHLQQAFNTGHMCQYELSVQVNGQTRFTHNRISPFITDNEIRALVISTDITRYKEAQGVLQQDKLQTERELHSKAKFLLNISQEMRGPMTVLKDTLQQLKAQQTDVGVNQVHTMQASIEHLGQIIEDIAVLSQKPSGEKTVESVSTSLWHVVDDLEALYLPQAAQMQIKLDFKHDVLPHYIQTDAFRLRQVLYNLMSCHLGICEQGLIGFNIHQAELANEPVIQFTVSNLVDEQQVDQWVSMFNLGLEDAKVACLDGSSVDAFNICKNLAGHLQGLLGARSIGGGRLEQWFILPLKWLKHNDSFSVLKHKPIVLAINDEIDRVWFRVFFQSMQLPFQEVSGDLIPKEISLLVSDYLQSKDSQWLWWLGEDYELTAAHGTSLTAPYRRETLYYRLTDYQASQSGEVGDSQPGRILLVEDNLNNQLVIKRTLEKLGYEVVVANNGEEGVAQFIATQVDCVIMDIQMPIMDGIEATRQIRQLDRPYVPVIALTANSQKEMEEACFAVGMDSFLTKPISRQVIQATLEEFLGKQAPAQDSRWVN
ncbi:MAG: response regulator [Bermanella sp.]